jgi:hypothetical protein
MLPKTPTPKHQKLAQTEEDLKKVLRNAEL